MKKPELKDFDYDGADMADWYKGYSEALENYTEHLESERQQLIEGMKRKDRLEILAEVCNDHSLSVEQIRSLSRKTHIVLARTDFIIRAHRNEYTHEEIAEAINRDRSTVSEHITNHYR